MKTKVALINEAMQLLGGAFNCHKGGKVAGQEWIASYVKSHKQHAIEALMAARQLPSPRLP